jgi:putative flippase GtrA
MNPRIRPVCTTGGDVRAVPPSRSPDLRAAPHHVQIMIGGAVSQLLRYGLVGVASNAVAFGIYVVITSFGAAPTVAMTLVYVTAAVIGFVGNRTLTFAHQGSIWGAGARYVVAHGLGYLINLSILVVLVDRLGYSHVWVQAFAIVVVAGYLFVAFKFFVFAKTSETSPPR